MAATVKFVKPEHEEILRQYIPTGDDEGVVLVFGKENQESLKEKEIEDQEFVPYDFGGNADCWIDTITNKQHTFFTFVKDNAERE